MQDQAAGRLWSGALDGERDRRTEAQPPDVEVVCASVRRGGECGTCESRDCVPAGERLRSAEAGEVRSDHRPTREQDVEPVVEVLSGADEPVAQQKWWTGAARQIPQAPAFVRREPLLESVHGRGHSVSI